MDLTDIQTIKSLCRNFDLRPSKKMGQNFLISKEPLKKMIAAAELKKNDVVLEIGPGFGVLTTELAPRVGQLIVVEKDKRLAEFLHKNIKTKKHKKIKIINNDVLKLLITDYPPATPEHSDGGRGRLPITDYKIIANLPYQITSPVIWKFLHQEKHKPTMMVLMVQQEVAQRICAQPGEMSLLSVLCQFYADCQIITKVKKGNFWPMPKVDSAIIKLKKQDTRNLSRLGRAKAGKIQKINENQFINMVKLGFSAKRKMLKNNLSRGLKISSDKIIEALKEAGLNEKTRAQEISVGNWVKLYNVLLG